MSILGSLCCCGARNPAPSNSGLDLDHNNTQGNGAGGSAMLTDGLSAPPQNPGQDSQNSTMELQVRARHAGTATASTSSATPTNAGSSKNAGMKPRKSQKPASEYICRDVPYIPQVGNSCWHAVFNMVNGRPNGGCSDYSDTPALYNQGDYAPIPKRLLKQVLNKEELAPVDGCNDPNREYSAQDLKDILDTHGQVAFAWRPEYNPFFQQQPHRYHWGVLIDADPSTNEIVYHDPILNRRDHAMSIEEFNRQRAREHDHTIVRRAIPGEAIPAAVTWRP